MADNGDSNDSLSSGKDEMDCAETTMVEIKIKTLDSQTYTMRVDKCVPVPALKEQIASVTGVLSEQQRLICRGKVLKDDQLLSAYHVEDGHTLHLVVRQPIAPSSESASNPDSDRVTTSGRVQGSGGSPTVYVSSFNISEQDGELSTSRFLSALLGSLGMANFGGGLEGIDLNESPSERISNAAGQRFSSRQPAEVTVSGQPFFSSGAFSFPPADPVESLQAPVIPDSFTTLTQNLSRLRQEFLANVEALSNSSQGAGFQEMAAQNVDASSFSAPQRGGLPTPSSLADVLLTTRQLLNEQVAESFLQLARQLQGHANVTDASERARIQTNTLRSGVLVHNLGALLLELARTTITLRMGQTPADGFVNAGPAVFISPTGANPIMVQPLSLQPGVGFGSTGGTVQHNLGLSPGSSRTIDIRIRRVLPTDANRRDSNRSRNVGQTDPVGPNSSASSAQAGSRDPRVPSSAASEPSPRGSVGILFPVLARVQRFNTGGVAAQASGQPPHTAPAPVDAGSSQSIPAPPAVEFQNLGTFRVDGSGGLVNEQVEDGLVAGLPAQLLGRIEELLRVVLPSEHHNAEGGTSTPLQQSGSTQVDPVSGSDGSRQQENSETVSEEGVFLSSMLQQLMPLIYENGGMGARNPTTGGDGGNDGERGSSSRHLEDDGTGGSLEQPEAKRPKRE